MWIKSTFLSCLSSRRKAEEDRIRKEEEKARRELIKQEYLRRKQQALMEEQGLVKPRPRVKSGRSRPKSLHRVESNSLTKGSTTRKELFHPHTVFHLHFVCIITFVLVMSPVCVVLVVLICLSVYVCYAGNTLMVSMLTKTKCSAADSRGGDPSILLCMTLPKDYYFLANH